MRLTPAAGAADAAVPVAERLVAVVAASESIASAEEVGEGGDVEYNEGDGYKGDKGDDNEGRRRSYMDCRRCWCCTKLDRLCCKWILLVRLRFLAPAAAVVAVVADTT